MRSRIAQVFLILCVTTIGCATGSHPENTGEARLHVKQGGDLLGKGDVDGAITEFRTALRLDPNHESAHENLGLALQKLERKAEAREEFTEVLRLLPKTPANQKKIEQMRQRLRE